MAESLLTYQQLKELRQEKFERLSYDNEQVNQLHDSLIHQVVIRAEHQVSKEWGRPPAPFTFFLLGSAGRYEQGLLSDQDHGIIYKDHNEDIAHYFTTLGNEISSGLEIVGYPLCEGNVMSSNPVWCRSSREWKVQVEQWLGNDDWKSIRYLLILSDARGLVGDCHYIDELIAYIFERVSLSAYFLQRMLANTQRIKKTIGVFGQFLVEQHGPHEGCIDLKEAAFFPYVNAIRLLAMKHKIMEKSSLNRLERLIQSEALPRELLIDIPQLFKQLLHYRLIYDQYVPVNQLTKGQTKEMKEIIRRGTKLYDDTSRYVEKG